MNLKQFQKNFFVPQITEQTIEKNVKLLNQHNPILIVAETQTSYHTPSDFYGLILVRDLRNKYKIKAPIILFSYMPFCYFANNYNLFRPFMGIPGHHFEHLPIEITSYSSPNSLRPLSDDELDDINASLLRIGGLINEEFHILKNIAIEDSKSEIDFEEYFIKLKEKTNLSFEKIIDYLQYPNIDLIGDIKSRLLKNLESTVFEKNNLQHCNNIISFAEEEVNKLLPLDDNSDRNEQIWKKKPWKVLFIDDSKKLLETAQKYFKDREIKCEIATSAKEAFEILENDVKTRNIAVVICAYRMRKLDNLDAWQEKQGYTILNEIYLNYKNYVSLFALSSANKRSLLRIMKRHETKIYVYSKDDVMGSEGGFNIFTEKVIEEGDKIVEGYTKLPRTKVWTSGYSNKITPNYAHYYRLHRLSLDYLKYNQELNIRAERYIEYIRNLKNNIEDIRPESVELQDSILQEMDYKESISRFRKKLLGRRICIGLFNILSLDKGKAYVALKHGRLDNPKEKKEAVNSLFSTYLGLKLGKTNLINEEQLLPEELTWYNQYKLEIFK